MKKILNIHYYKYNMKRVKDALKKDYVFNATFRYGTKELSRKDKKKREYKAVVLYRKYQCNLDNIWGFFYRVRLHFFAHKTGIDFMGNPNIGNGLVIGHWGRIVVNPNAQFGEGIVLTHNVTIGRDIRGKRAGTPIFGNNVCIRTNSTVVGNIKIGDDVLIAPNTFVNFDVPSHSVVVGNPASVHPKANATEGHVGWFD